MGPSIFVQTFFFIIAGVVLLGVALGLSIIFSTDSKGKFKRKNKTRLDLFADYVEGIGLATKRSAAFLGLRLLLSGFTGLRNFKLTYAQILNVDILTKKSALVLQTAATSYICCLPGLDLCAQYRDAIFLRRTP